MNGKVQFASWKRLLWEVGYEWVNTFLSTIRPRIVSNLTISILFSHSRMKIYVKLSRFGLYSLFLHLSTAGIKCFQMNYLEEIEGNFTRMLNEASFDF